MSDVPLGQLIDGNAERDAIHIAIAPVMANERLSPGQPIGFVEAGNTRLVGHVERPLGIVDPFLDSVVVKGQWCWMLLYPNTVTGMRHHWSHPAFQPPPSMSESQQFLASFAQAAGLSYDRMMEIVTDFVRSGDVYTEINSDRMRDAWYALDEDEFWKHFEAVTGLAKPSEDSLWSVPFSCSC